MNHTFSVEHAVKYGIQEAILIGNFQFWLAKNRADKRNQYDGRTWTYNSATAFSELLPYFSTDTIDRIVKRLVTKGIIMTGNYNEKATDHTRWFAFVNEAEFLGPVGGKKKEPKQAKGQVQAPFREIAEPQEKAHSDSAISRNDSAIPGNGFREIAETLYRTDITTDVNADTNLQTPGADAPEVCAAEPAASGSDDLGAQAPAEQATAAADPQGPSQAFEAAWTLYPARTGNAKHMALSAWKARVTEGVSEKALLDGAKDYAAHCKREKVAPKFVMAAGRFFGTEAHYAANWSSLSAEPQPSFFDDDADNIQPI